MRIVAGEMRSRIIQTPPGASTRPTLDRVRENLFNMLQLLTPGARVLDLFSGSGALALEALSRGAVFAVMVDHDVKANAVERANVTALGCDDRARVIRAEWQTAVDQMAGSEPPFQLIFLDPPYEMTDLRPVTSRLLQAGLANAGTRLIVEHAAEKTVLVDERFELLKTRRYGIAGVTLYRLGRADDD